jgi:ABC-type multidrug transport system fused ATPase/permease subunit
MFQLVLYALTVVIFILKDYFVGALSLHVYHWSIGVYLVVIIGLWMLAEVVSVFRNRSMHNKLMENGNYLHDIMLKILFKLKLQWLISHPSARVWFKYSYDLRLIDEELNHNIQHLIEYSVFLIGSVIVINLLYIGVMIIPSVLIGWYCHKIFKRYIRTEKKLFKFEAEYEAKMYDVLLLSIDQEYKYRIMRKGILLRNRFIRVSNQLERVRIHVDYYSHRWLGIRLMTINVTIVFFCYLLPAIIVLYLQDTIFHRTIIELYMAIIWSLKFTYYLQHGLESMVQVLDDEVSFGRIEHYFNNA